MKISELTTVSRVGNDVMIPCVSGGQTRSLTVAQIVEATVEALKGDVTLQDQIDDNVWVQCRLASNPATPYLIRPHKWANKSEIWTVDGVVLYHSGRFMLIAPDETSLPMAAGTIDSVHAHISNAYVASMDFDGKENTEALLENEACGDVSVAPGYCAAYANGGQTAGKWWLPSVGEILAMFANVEKINCVMRLIGGTELDFGGNPLSTSTMTDLSHYWRVRFNEWPNFHGWGTLDLAAIVRPVSAFGL